MATLQGRMAGVHITQSSGVPGGSFDIRIRGQNSIRSEGNAPLYIVDGMPFGSQSLGYGAASSGIMPGRVSPLNNINPNDIESIEVLRDADATAIYGSRGANGVVLITTKKGKRGKTKFTLDAYSGTGQVTRTMELLNTSQYIDMRRQGFANDGITTYPASAYDVNGRWDAVRYTDWQKELIGGTASFTSLQAGVSGGSQNTQFLVSGGMRRETTVFPGDARYGRGNLHSSINHESDNGRFRLKLNTGYLADKNILPPTDLSFQAIVLPPNAPALYDSTGNLNWEGGTFNNPLAPLLGRYQANTSNFNAGMTLSYELLPGLELRSIAGYNDNRISESRQLPSTTFNPSFGLGPERSSLYTNQGSRNSWNFEPQLDFKIVVGKGELNILAGGSFQQQRSVQLSQLGSGFASNSLIGSLAAATRVTVAANPITDYRYQGFFGRVNYNWREKYILNLTGRRDGSSRFGPGNRFANFGAVGAAWLFSREGSLAEKLPWLSLGKLRASYGSSGSDQIGDYQYLDTWEVNGTVYNGINGIQPSRLFNANFGWETNRKLEAALEIALFDDRIFFSAAWYRNRSSNQLVGIPLPGTTGFSSIQSNLDATVENSGTEFELNTTIFRKKNFRWAATANLSFNRNRLLEFPNIEGSTYANLYVIGQPLGIQKVYHFTGLNPTTGLYEFQDYNGDGRITSPDDRQHLADTSPKWFGGFSNQLQYKNWNFDFLFQFVKQNGRNYLYNASFAGDMGNQPIAVLDVWPQAGASTQPYTSGANAAAANSHALYANSDASVSDASYIRLKNVSLSYAIPLGTRSAFSARIYVQGQNLLTITRYKGADPENQSFFFLPPLRQFTLGVQLGL